MYTAQTVYTEVCKILLEDTGLALVYDEASFLVDLRVSVHRLLQESGLVKRLLVVPLHFATKTYELPVVGMDVQEVYADSNYLHESSGFYLDESDPEWQGSVGTPEQWRQDQIAANQIEIAPAPSREGRQVLTDPLVNLTGTIAGYSSGTDFSVQAAEPLYGTIATVGGDYYVDVDAPMFGTISKMVCSDSNLLLVATAQRSNNAMRLTSLLELVPDSLASYLKWFVLEKIFSTDGESKDLERAKYCHARVEEVINIAKAIEGEDLEQEG